MHDPFKQGRLEPLVDDAVQSLRRAEQDRFDKSVELGKQHAEYVEKLAFGSAAILAAFVSLSQAKKIFIPPGSCGAAFQSARTGFFCSRKPRSVAGRCMVESVSSMESSFAEAS